MYTIVTLNSTFPLPCTASRALIHALREHSLEAKINSVPHGALLWEPNRCAHLVPFPTWVRQRCCVRVARFSATQVKGGIVVAGSEPLRCATGIWDDQGDRYSGAEKRAGAGRTHKLQAGPLPSEGCSHANDSSGRGITSTHCPSIWPVPLAPIPDDGAATTLSG